MAARRSNSKVSVHDSAAGLALSATAARVQELLRQRTRLLREVQKKQRQLQSVIQQGGEATETVARGLAPLVERRRSLVLELTTLFDELLAAGRLTSRVHKQVAKLRRALEVDGLLPPCDEASPSAAGADQDEASPEEPTPPPRRASSKQSRPSSRESTRPELPSAHQPSDDRRSLRDVFRNLARALHPDQARDEAERLRRTELMKTATRAYEAGDLAGLLGLEQSWNAEQSPTLDGDADARRRELERLNRELLDQLRRVTRQLRDQKYELQSASRGLAPEELLRRVDSELAGLAQLCELVRRFRDGKIAVEHLLSGCVLPRRLSLRTRAAL